jgi:ankyrin repeat protein
LYYLLPDIAVQLQSRTHKQLTPLILAAAIGHSSLCQFFLDHGADVNASDDKKYTSLMQAAQKGQLSTVELLLKNGADPRARNVYGETALFRPCALGNIEIVQALLSSMTTEDLMLEDEEGNTAAFRSAG